MKKYDGQTFEKQIFVLEENYFVNCALRECDLFYSGGDVEWESTRFENCRLHWQGLAAKTKLVFALFGLLKEQQTPPPMLKTSAGPVN